MNSPRIDTLIHVIGVVVFLGNFVAAWLAYAMARRAPNAAALAALMSLVNAGDRWLTPISLVTIAASGIHAASRNGLSITGTGWIAWSLVALGVSGLIFVGRLRGLQLSLEAAAREASLDRRPFDLMLVTWARWACAGTLAALVTLALMVLQPALPGF